MCMCVFFSASRATPFPRPTRESKKKNVVGEKSDEINYQERESEKKSFSLHLLLLLFVARFITLVVYTLSRPVKGVGGGGGEIRMLIAKPGLISLSLRLCWRAFLSSISFRVT